MKNPFGMTLLGDREVYLAWQSIAYFEDAKEHAGTAVVLVTGERIEAPNWSVEKFWELFDGRE